MSLQFNQFTLVCYLSEEEIYNTINSLMPKEYAFILHDKDCDSNGEIEKAHYHIYLRFNSEIYLPKIAKLFGVADNLVESVRNKNALLCYFIHKWEPEKHHYQFTDIRTNIIDLGLILDNFCPKENYINFVINLLDNSPVGISFSYLVSQCVKNNYSDFVCKYAYLTRTLYNDYKERTFNNALNPSQKNK